MRPRKSDNVVVFDLETVPDSDGIVSIDVPRDTEQQAGSFPKHIYHRIICLGALIATFTPAGWKVQSIGAPHIGSRSEPELIRSFVDKLAELSPTLVTFNGSSFDLPVLRYRAMKYLISAPVFEARPYFNRYSEESVDLCDVLASYNSRSKISLDELSRSFGLEGKPDGLSGANVEEYFKAGRIEEISRYCQGDVENTYRIWLRYELFRGSLTSSQFKYSEDGVVDVMSRKR